jgi:hypothetical protein
MGIKNEHRVFVIGMNKTGTSSIFEALKTLGFKMCPEQSLQSVELFNQINDGDFTNLEKFLEKYNGFKDRPWNHPKVYEFLDKNYENSKFILTIRDEDEWVDSYIRWDKKVRLRKKFYYQTASKICYGVDDFLSDSELMKKTYRSWNESVINYFKEKDNILILDIKGQNNWDLICKFLNKPKPNLKFPHANKNS